MFDPTHEPGQYHIYLRGGPHDLGPKRMQVVPLLRPEVYFLIPEPIEWIPNGPVAEYVKIKRAVFTLDATEFGLVKTGPYYIYNYKETRSQ